MNSEPTYTDLQGGNEEIWGNAAAITSIGGQDNGLIGYYMPPTLYVAIYLIPYQKPTNKGNNPSYPTGATKEAHRSIKDYWEYGRFDFVTHEN